MSYKTRTRKQDIVISPVAMRDSDQLTLTQKYPHGFVCNVLPEHQALMQQAADELGFEITLGYPRNEMHLHSAGVYVPETVLRGETARDPKTLIQRFEDLKFQAWLKRQAAQ